MKMVFRVEVLIVLLALGYVAFFPIYSGQFEDYLLRSNILVPFAMVWAALCLLSMGMRCFIGLFASVNVFLSASTENYAGDKVLNSAIWFSYVSAVLWILYALSTTPYNASADYWHSLVGAASTSILYGFLLAEFVFRPIKIRANIIDDKH